MALFRKRRSRGPATRHHARPDLPGENPLIPPEREPINLQLSAAEADALHAALEESLAGGLNQPELERIHRLLEWRILATRGGTGLTAHLSDLARDAATLEEYEATRDEYLGPILGGLERGENRDP